jgi:hypothetical protein
MYEKINEHHHVWQAQLPDKFFQRGQEWLRKGYELVHGAFYPGGDLPRKAHCSQDKLSGSLALGAVSRLVDQAAEMRLIPPNGSRCAVHSNAVVIVFIRSAADFGSRFETGKRVIQGCVGCLGTRRGAHI